jgi:hypothetical protein
LWLVDGAREGNSNWIIAIGCLSLSPSIFPFMDGLHKIGYYSQLYILFGVVKKL